MEMVFVVVVTTEACDRYVWLYTTQPTREEVIQRLVDTERAAPYDFYDETATVEITEQEVGEAYKVVVDNQRWGESA